MAEASPAGKVTLDEKLDWLADNIGCMPVDSVIAPDGVTSSLLPVVNCQLASTTVAHYHDKDKLLNALQQCIDISGETTLTQVVNS